MRIFLAGLGTETNTFSPIPTGRLAFDLDRALRERGRADDDDLLAAFEGLAAADHHEVVRSLSAGAQPAGPTVRAVYETLREAILEDLQAAGAIDVVLLSLHGAMVADGYDDCEGDLLERVRAIAPDAVVGAELDPHCSLTERMVRCADLIVIMREYPHTDFVERAGDLYRHCLAAAKGAVRPIAALFDCRMIGFYPTAAPAMRAVVDALRQAGDRPGIITAELAHGFPWGDVADAGARVLVYADGDGAAAKAEAERLGRSFYESRRDLVGDFPGLEASLDMALALEGRVVLGDFADNPGGGAPGDSTFALEALLSRQAAAVAVGALYDPEAAALCADAGAGARLCLRLGGKLGPQSGRPLDLQVTVLAAAEEHSCDAFGQRARLGRSAAVRCNGVDILIVSTRSQLYGRDGFTGLGISLDDKRLIIVKSSAHYRASFAPIADHLWTMATPGTLSLDFASLDYRRVARPLFPKVDDPLAGEAAVAHVIACGRRPRSVDKTQGTRS
jgi:microcystin degradation protein MlrC